MTTNIQKMACGNCGGKNFSIYITENNDLISECNNCQSKTEITIRAKIHLDWGENSDGILSKM